MADEVRARGRPRSEACRQAVLSATVQLLEEQRYGEVTMEGIAARAGVSKQTLYKWWPGKARLAMEAYAALVATRITEPDTGALEADLKDLVWQTCQSLSRGNMAPTVAGMIAEAQSDPELAVELRETLIASRRQVGARVLERARQRGEVPAGLDVPLSLDLLYGPIWYRLLLRNGPLDAAFARALVDGLLPGLRGAAILPP